MGNPHVESVAVVVTSACVQGTCVAAPAEGEHRILADRLRDLQPGQGPSGLVAEDDRFKVKGGNAGDQPCVHGVDDAHAQSPRHGPFIPGSGGDFVETLLPFGRRGAHGGRRAAATYRIHQGAAHVPNPVTGAYCGPDGGRLLQLDAEADVGGGRIGVEAQDLKDGVEVGKDQDLLYVGKGCGCLLYTSRCV